MMYKFVLAAVVGGLAFAAAPASAAQKHRSSDGQGYAIHRGGYSYDKSDSINTYGDSRSKYGGASVYRDPTLDRQSPGGPFDHGFFFDSAIGPHGGQAPYMN